MQCRKQIMRNSGVKQRNGSSEPSSCWGTPHATGPWWSLTHALPRIALRLSTRSFRTCRWIKSIGSCWRRLSKPPECTAPQQKPIISIQKSYLSNSTLEGFEGMAHIVMVLFCCFPPAWLNFDFGSQVVQGSFLWENVSFLAVSVDRGSKQYWNALLNDVQVVVSCKSPCPNAATTAVLCIPTNSVSILFSAVLTVWSICSQATWHSCKEIIKVSKYFLWIPTIWMISMSLWTPIACLFYTRALGNIVYLNLWFVPSTLPPNQPWTNKEPVSIQ